MKEQQLLKLLLNNIFYQKNKHQVPVSVLAPDTLKIYETIKYAHDAYKRDLNVAEVEALFYAKNPTLTDANKQVYAHVFQLIRDAEYISADIGAAIIEELWKKDFGRQLAEKGIQIAEGKENNLLEVNAMLKKAEKAFTPSDDVAPVTTDVEEVLHALDTRPSWKFNLPSLARRVPGISSGEFAVVLARPETGKTAFMINLIAGPQGFAEQGAKVHLLGNEEPLIRSMARAISSSTGMTFDEVRANPKAAKAAFNKVAPNIVFVDDVTLTLNRLDSYCRKHKPDIVIVDQLDRVSPTGSFESGHEKLSEIYSKAREIAKINSCALIGVSQASAEAEGKTKVHYSHAEGSKTGKAAAADLIIGIGKAEEESDQSMNNLRYLTISKNKLTGYHGTIPCKIIPALSRYED